MEGCNVKGGSAFIPSADRSSPSQTRTRLLARPPPTCQVKPPVPQVLREHSDEVWHVAFSPCGSFLASASKDGTVCVYDVPPRGRGPVTVRHVLRAHAGPVAFIAWAPCRQLLASCGTCTP